MRFYLSLYLFIAGLYLLTASGRIGRMSDSATMFKVAESMINEHSLSSEPCDPRYDDPEIGSLCIPGRGGRYYASYGFVPSLAVVPAILGARILSAVIHIDPMLLAKASVSFFTLLVAPLICVVLAMWIIDLGYRRSTALLGACILAFASPFWHNSLSGFLSEPYFTLAMLAAAYLLCSRRIHYACVLSGFAFGVGCGTRVAGVVLFPAFIACLAIQMRVRKMPWASFIRDAVSFTTPVALWGALIAWTNYARFGSIFKTGYQVAFPTIAFTFSNPLLRGTRDLLFNGEVGLLLFAPWAVLGFIYFPKFLHLHKPEAVLCATIFVINFVFYAKFYTWHGGWAGGPRYLVPTIPFVIIVIAPILEALQKRGMISENGRFWGLQRTAVVFLLVSGLIVQGITITYPRDRYYADLVFYAHRVPKPSWYGSIPLAALDYWSDTSIPKTEASYREPNRSGTRAMVESDTDPMSYWEHANAAATEDEFINLLPHPENATLPEMMVLKRRLMGLPAKAIYSYLLVVFILILSGAVGLRRYAEPQELLAALKQASCCARLDK